MSTERQRRIGILAALLRHRFPHLSKRKARFHIVVAESEEGIAEFFARLGITKKGRDHA